MRYRIVSALFSIFLGTPVVAATDIYQLPVNASMEDCKILGGTEPAGFLWYERASKVESRKIYSDLCTVSQQPLSVILIDGSGEIVGVGMENTFRADGVFTFSTLWRQKAGKH